MGAVTNTVGRTETRRRLATTGLLAMLSLALGPSAGAADPPGAAPTALVDPVASALSCRTSLVLARAAAAVAAATAAEPALGEQAGTLLERARRELATGRGASALLVARDAWLLTVPFARRERQVIEDRAALSQLVVVAESDLDRAATRLAAAQVPALVRAVASAVFREAGPYAAASLAYADQTELASGIYYAELARAHGELVELLVNVAPTGGASTGVSADCAAWPPAGDGQPTAFAKPAQLAAELAAIDGTVERLAAATATATAATAATPVVAPTDRGRLIRASARLKLVRELLMAADDTTQGATNTRVGYLDAAALVLIEVRRTLAPLLEAPPPTSATALLPRSAPGSLDGLFAELVAADQAPAPESPTAVDTAVAAQRVAWTLAGAARLRQASPLTIDQTAVVAVGAEGTETRGRRPLPITLLRWPYS